MKLSSKHDPIFLIFVGVVFAALLSMCTPTFANVTGNQLLKMCDAAENTADKGGCMGYITGALDMGDEILFCIPQGTTYRQLGDMVLKTLRDIPSIRNGHADGIVAAVMQSAFPCPEKKPRGPTL